MASCSCLPLHENTSSPPTFCRVCPLSGKDHMSSLTLSSHSSFLSFLISYCLINLNRPVFAGVISFCTTQKNALRAPGQKGGYNIRVTTLFCISSYPITGTPRHDLLLFQPHSSEATFTCICQERSHSHKPFSLSDSPCYSSSS